MARKCNEENERIKRHYLQFLREAKRSDMATVDKAAEAILRFERSTGFKPFKRFHIEQAVAFKRHLSNEKNARTGAPLAKATVDSTLRMVKAFVLWLAGQPGYKSRIAYADAEYFNLNAKDARIAHTARETIYPTPEQCRHAFTQMPSATPLQRRDKALFAFLMLTGARDGAVASMRLKHVDLVQGCVYQDARDVKTKFAKTFTMNRTGFTGEQKARKVSHDQRKPREPFFDRGTCARGAHGSGERSGLQIAVAGGRLHRGEVRMQ